MTTARTTHSAVAHRLRRQRRAGGFTLIEAALATVIISTGVLSILAAQQAYHRKNNWANHSGTAMLLANEIRELTFAMPHHDPVSGKATLGPEAGEITVAAYDDLDDFAGVVTNGYGAGTTFSPPINALRQQIPNMAGWSQVVTVENVLPENISVTSGSTQPLTASTGLMRVTVNVLYQAPGEDAPSTMGNLVWVVGSQ